MSDFDRRTFLSIVPAAAAAAAVACRQPPRYDARAFTLPPYSEVALLEAARYDGNLSDVITRGLALLRMDVRGKRVLLKPNMVEYEHGTVVNTNPQLIAGAADAMLRAGAREVVVGEGPGHRRDVEYLLTSTGLYDYLRDLRVRFVDLNHDDVRRVRLRSSFTRFGELALPVELLDSDLVVSMPKLKTHHWTGMTCSMKNLFGVVPGAVYGWPKNPLHMQGINESIVDLTATVRPGLAIVDGIVGMEGDGPIMGRPRHVGVIAMGRDPVAVDATCARLMGIEPLKLWYIRDAAAFLGNAAAARIRQVAESPARFTAAFELLPAWAELLR